MITHTCTSDTETEVLVWNVSTLWEAAASLPVQCVPLADVVSQLDQTNWAYREPRPGVWNDVHHAKRIFETDLSCPIILSSNGFLMDGAHRLAKAWILGHETVNVVRFDSDPEPDERRPKEPQPLPMDGGAEQE